MNVIKSNLADDKPSVIQFENANEGRSYPFSDNSTLMSVDGKSLPDNIITDLHLVLPNGTKPYLSSVYMSKGMLSVCLRVMDVEKEFRLFKGNFDFSLVRELAASDTLMKTKEEFNKLLERLKSLDFHARGSDAVSVTVRASDFEPYVPYRLENMTGSSDMGGVITFGSVEFPETPVSYRFGDVAVPVAEGAVARYAPAKLRRFVDPRTGASVSGDVKLSFSSHVTATRQEGNKVKLELSEAAKAELLSDCEKKRPSNVCGSVPIRSINGILPDSKNRIVIWFH